MLYILYIIVKNTPKIYIILLLLMIPKIYLPDYKYVLPIDRIPNFPAKERDQSKLLFYNKGDVSSYIFSDISKILPTNSLLIFNDTKVFPARLIFKKSTGAIIEIFCLQPMSNQNTNESNSEMFWLCMVGNEKRWKKEVLKNEYITAEYIEKRKDEVIVKFSFASDSNMYDILENNAELPLPPYMNRKANNEDKIRYQTVYASVNGSVAAPTAGLHFTNNVIKSIDENNIFRQKLTLHVGAGTFKPIKTEKIDDHAMHPERFSVTLDLIKCLINHSFVVAIGTTSTRVLESLYWLGVQLSYTKTLTEVYIQQWEPYQNPTNISTTMALENVYNYMIINNLEVLHGLTQIIIVPGYVFKVCKAIITNFHQPESTLILLVAAFLGNNWKKVYDYALSNDYRFLSYGDSSLLIP